MQALIPKPKSPRWELTVNQWHSSCKCYCYSSAWVTNSVFYSNCVTPGSSLVTSFYIYMFLIYASTCSMEAEEWLCPNAPAPKVGLQTLCTTTQSVKKIGYLWKGSHNRLSQWLLHYMKLKIRVGAYSITQWLVSSSSPVVPEVWIETQTKVAKKALNWGDQTGIVYFQLTNHCLSVFVCSVGTLEKSRLLLLKTNLVARCSPNLDLGCTQKSLGTVYLECSASCFGVSVWSLFFNPLFSVSITKFNLVLF